MILNLYHKLIEIANEHFIVNSSKIIYLTSGEPQKIRLFIIDETILDIWLSTTGKYSYHWDRRINHKGIYRFDNAPHNLWSNIKTFPDHLHYEKEDNVKESFISKNPDQALMEVLDFVSSIITKEKQLKLNKLLTINIYNQFVPYSNSNI